MNGISERKTRIRPMTTAPPPNFIRRRASRVLSSRMASLACIGAAWPTAPQPPFGPIYFGIDYYIVLRYKCAAKGWQADGLPWAPVEVSIEVRALVGPTEGTSSPQSDSAAGKVATS